MSIPSKNSDPRDIKDNNDEKKSKFRETFDQFSKNEKIEDFYQFAQHNPWHTIAGIAAVLALITYFFAPFWGGLILGVIGGLYFGDVIIQGIKNFESLINFEGGVKTIILGTILIALLVAAPAIFLGVAIVTVIKYIIANK